MTCEECNRCFYEAAEKFLPPGKEREFVDHLASCPQCRESFEATAELCDFAHKSLPAFRAEPPAELEQRFLIAACRPRFPSSRILKGAVAAGLVIFLSLCGYAYVKGFASSRPVPVPAPVVQAVTIPVSVAAPVSASIPQPSSNKGDKMNMTNKASAVVRTVAAAAVATGIVASASVTLHAEGSPIEGTASAPVRMVVNPDASFFWRTLETNQVTLVWAWPTGATRADLTITDGVSTIPCVLQTFTDTEITSYLWNVGLPRKDSDERLYELTLAFSGSNGQSVGGLLEAVIAGARGVNGQALRLVASKTTDESWLTIPSDPTLLAFDAGTEAFAINGQAVSNWPETASWYLWHPIPIGTYTVSRTDADETQVVGSLKKNQDGTLYSIH